MIGTGDMLWRRRISRLLFSREGLNDAGQLAFTAFFEDGSSGVFVATPHISRQPDLHIAKQGESTFRGKNIYNSDGSSQTRTQTLAPGATATYIIRLQNDSTDPEDFKVTGTPGNAQFSVRYFNVDTEREITSQMTSLDGWRARTLAAGRTRRVRLVVVPAPQASEGARLAVLVKAGSVFESAKRDTVKAVTIVGAAN